MAPSFNGRHLFQSLNERISKKIRLHEKSFNNGDFDQKHYIPFRIFVWSKSWKIMKAISKTLFPGIFSNSINRNLTLIFLFGFLVALTLVTTGVILLGLIIGG